MTKQDEILNGITDTNLALKQLTGSIALLVESQKVKPQETPEIKQIGFVQKTFNSIVENPKTSLAGASTLILTVSRALLPQYSLEIESLLTGIAGTGLIAARDSRPIAKSIITVPEPEILG